MKGVVGVAAVPAALAALTLAGVLTSSSVLPDPVPVATGLIIAAAAALLLRRSRPVLAATASSWLVTAYLLLLHSDLSVQPAFEPFLVMLAAFFSLGLHADAAGLRVGLAAAGLPLVVVEAAAVSAGRPVGEVAPTLLFWGAAVVLGRLLHRHREESTHARSALLAAEEGARAQAAEAAAAERSRIARELHDVVAHSLSVVVLHAGVERRLLDDPASTTWQALDTIERTGRTALTELRQLLGLLQETPHGAGLEPQPTLADIDGLVAPLRSAGHDVEVAVSGDLPALPAGLALSAYRILQEAVTNVLKHAPGAGVTVHVDDRADAVALEVANDAPAGPAGAALPGLGGGHGLVGMRERVRVYGGQLVTEPRADGGFLVRAVLPKEAG